ncbi:MAG: hypothetical protein ACLGHJ_06615 [Gammaproteobacteria bacterium]
MRALLTLLTLLTSLVATLLPALAIAAPADDALAALREMRMLNYRIQTRYHVGTLAAADTQPYVHLKQDVQRFDDAIADLQAAVSRGGWRVPIAAIADRWQSVRWFAVQDLPVPSPEILPREIAYDRARRPASISAMKIAGQQLASALVDGMMAVPAPREPASNIDFALTALELQYIAYRYVDLAGMNPALDISGEPSLEILETAFGKRMASLESRYGNDPAFAGPMRTLRASWLFIAPALPRAQDAPVPVLVSRYTSLATDALLPVFTGRPASASPRD